MKVQQLFFARLSKFYANLRFKENEKNEKLSSSDHSALWIEIIFTTK